MPQNKKFLAQKEREDRQKRIIILSTIAILVVVFGLIGYGVLDRYVLKPKTVVIQLESQSINAVEFEQLVRWERRNLIGQIDQILQTYQQFGGSPEIFAYFEQDLMQAVTQLQQPLLVGQGVFQSLTNDLIILVEAEKMGIEVDDNLLDREIQEVFGFFTDGTPTPIPTGAPRPASTLTSQQMTLVPPTDAPEGNQDTSPTNTPQIEETSEGDPDPTATPLLIPTEYTEELFIDNYNQFLDSLKIESGITEKTIRKIVTMSVLRRMVMETVTSDIDKIQEQIWIRHILVEDEETAKEVAKKLADGQDFPSLAAEYSKDDSNKDNGGDLGWFARGMMVLPFEEAAFPLEVGEISDPVETDFGWHILQALGKDQVPMDETAFLQAQNVAFSDWLEEKRLEYQPEVNEDWVSFIPSEPALPQDYVDYIQSLSMEPSSLSPEIPQE
jgi:parvulin-like peptidyl-prolyl isomerase